MKVLSEKDMESLHQDSLNTHAVWREFENFLISEYGNDYWRELSGYECMCKIETYVETHPEIKIMGCDDSYFSSGFLVAIPHKNMGNTIIFIPQTTIINNIFFLYPSQQKSLIQTLASLNNESTT